MNSNLFKNLKKIDVGLTSQPVKEWKDRYSSKSKPGTFCIEETKMGPKLTVITESGQPRIGWPRKRSDGIIDFGVHDAPRHVKVAVVEYFSDPKAFMTKVKESEATTVPGTMKSQEKPDLVAVDFEMEDYSDDDMTKAKDKTTGTEKGLREVPDKELEQQKAKESKTNEDSANTFRQRLNDFLDASWQEDTEIEFINLVSKYRDKFEKAPDKSIKDYLKRLADTNKVWANQMLSDRFTSQLQELVEDASESIVVGNNIGRRGCRRDLREQLRFCGSCNKTFRSNEAKCKCKNEKTELIGERESSDIVGSTKSVFKVEYTLDGQKKEDRVMAFDEVSAKKQVEKTRRGAKATSAKKVADESKVNEHYDKTQVVRYEGEEGWFVIHPSGEEYGPGSKQDAISKAQDIKGEEGHGYVVINKPRKKVTEESKTNEGLADKAGKKPGDFDKTQLEAGTKVEMEHTDDSNKAMQIAMDHLTEDADYYVKLAKMEAGKCADESKVNESQERRARDQAIEIMKEAGLEPEPIGDYEIRLPMNEKVNIELKCQGYHDKPVVEGKVPDDVDPEDKKVEKLIEDNLNEPAGFESCVERGGRVRTITGPNKEHGLKAGEYVKYCYIGNKSFRGEVETKKSEAKVSENESVSPSATIAQLADEYARDIAADLPEGGKGDMPMEAVHIRTVDLWNDFNEMVASKLKDHGVTVIGESKVNEQDEMTILGKGMTDKLEAERIAKAKKGQVVPDIEDPKKFMVIMPKEKNGRPA